MALIMRWIREEAGAAAAEYVLLLGCISMLLIAALTQLGNNLNSILQLMADFFNSVH